MLDSAWHRAKALKFLVLHLQGLEIEEWYSKQNSFLANVAEQH
jgi:hypothetical protein